jgi:tetraacyldisaccharide 4'-kinase
MKRIIQNAWAGRSWLACLLWPVSAFYSLLVFTRKLLYRHGFLKSVKLPVPVIVVGNVVAGGGGKTPLVISLVQRLQNAGWRVGVVSRGYGRRSSAALEVLATTPIHDSGDEPMLIKRRTGAPVFVGLKRASTAMALLEAHPGTQVIVCDDGMQHHALQRDIEIVVFDNRGPGNGWLLPAGPLREPWPMTGHTIPHLVLHTGSKPAFDGFTSSRRLSDEALARDGTSIPLGTFQGQHVTALAAIANPDAFFEMLKSRGILLDQSISLPDHHDISLSDMQPSSNAIVLCTEKDAVKLFALESAAAMKILAVPLEFEPEPAFFRALDDLLSPLLSQLPSSHGTQTA